MKPVNRELGTCYYPEHWPDDLWQTDAEKMANLGLKWVRIGEFSWSRLEPKENDFCFDDDYVTRRALARSIMEFCTLGIYPWTTINHSSIW